MRFQSDVWHDGLLAGQFHRAFEDVPDDGRVNLHWVQSRGAERRAGWADDDHGWRDRRRDGETHAPAAI